MLDTQQVPLQARGGEGGGAASSWELRRVEDESLRVCDTSAVGKSGTANCSRPWIWICMVVRDLWKMVSGCRQESSSKAVNVTQPQQRRLLRLRAVGLLEVSASSQAVLL